MRQSSFAFFTTTVNLDLSTGEQILPWIRVSKISATLFTTPLFFTNRKRVKHEQNVNKFTTCFFLELFVSDKKI
jgi:hypothetical protein